jgi:hypothetical protein
VIAVLVSTGDSGGGVDESRQATSATSARGRCRRDIGMAL